MTLQSSGQISVSDINVELNQTSNNIISLDDGNVRNLLKKTSGTIAIADAYGKSNVSNQFIAVVTSTTPNKIITSDDGITWIQRLGINDRIGCIFNQGNLTLFGCESNNILSTNDVRSFANNYFPALARPIALAYGNSIYLAGTDDTDDIYHSIDGITWSLANSVNINISIGSINDIVFTGNSFVIVAFNQGHGEIYRTVNGTTFAKKLTINTDNFSKLVYGNNLCIAIVNNSDTSGILLALSNDKGLTWTIIYNGNLGVTVDFSLTAISFINGVFIIGTSTGKIFTTIDGINFTYITDVGYNIQSITFGNNLYCISIFTGIGGYCYILTSSDLINWTYRYSHQAATINRLAFY